MSEAGGPAGLKCPGCGEPPVFLFGGGTQAWCGTDDCRWLIWDPTKTLADLTADVQVVDLPAGDGPEPAP